MLVAALGVAAIAVLLAISAGAGETLARYAAGVDSGGDAYTAEFGAVCSDFDVMLVNADDTYEEADGDVADISSEWSAAVNFVLTPTTEVRASVSIVVEGVPDGIDVELVDSGITPTREDVIDDAVLTHTFTFANALMLDAPTQGETYPFTLIFSLEDVSKSIDVSATDGAKIYARITQEV
jgi:hypothetical protein